MKAWVRINRGEWAEAAHWADRSARTPGAHFLIDMLAAMAHQANGNTKDGLMFAMRARERRPDATLDNFFTAFPLPLGSARNTAHAALAKLGF